MLKVNNKNRRENTGSPILMQVLLEWDFRPAGWDNRMFWGFRSLWMIPLAWRTLMAPAICCRNTRMVSSL